MDELIVKRLRGEATDIEVRQLDHWRAESAENEREYRLFISLWDRSCEPEGPAIRPAPAPEQLMREGDARRARSRGRAARRPVLRWAWGALGVVATATAVLLFDVAAPPEPGASTHALFPVESSSGPGDITTLGLSDGSVVRVTRATRVEFPAAVDRREVMLEGKAFFAVAPDTIPFVVRTHIAEVRVRGTRFEVATQGTELRLVVVDGTVRLEAPSGSLDAGPGQVVFVRSGSPPRIVDYVDVWSILDWKNGLLIYQATPLSTIAEELRRHFGRKVTIVDEALENVRITAWFQDEPFEEVVSTLCLLASASCQVTGREATIGR